MTTVLRWTSVRKILCIRLDNLGDVLMTTPAIRALRETFPAATITLLTSRVGSHVAPLIPEIDEIITFDSPWVRTYGEPLAPETVMDLVGNLRWQQFDAAVIFTVFSQNPLPSAMLAYLAEIPRRLAFCHENPYHLLNPWIPDPEPHKIIRHEVERQLSLVATIGAETANRRISLRIPQEGFATVRRKLVDAGVALNRPWALMHPGCTEVRRQYPRQGFIAAGCRLRDRLGCQIIVTGSSDERILAGEVAHGIGRGAFSIAGETSVPELCALISSAGVLISNNTAPVHIAAAVGTPVVDLYARTNPQHTPWMVPARVLYFDVPCKACERGICAEAPHPPLEGVDPEEVAQAAQELLGHDSMARAAPTGTGSDSIRRID